VVLPSNIFTAPFYRRYEKILSDENCSFDFILWNRNSIKEQSLGNIISFDCFDEVNSRSIFKSIKYLRFANFVKSKLLEKHYDKLIFLGSHAGIMALLSGFLKKHYRHDYWLDIRDHTFENIKPYYWAMDKAIKNSYATVISSKGYESFLPKYDYIIAHNIDKTNIEASIAKRSNNSNNSERIRISFIGLVRYFDENKKLLSILKNDERFILQYYGSNSEVLEKYCLEQEIYNVEFHGWFQPEETSRFYAQTDVINNVYGNRLRSLRTALSNKLYFSAALKMPILVSPNTYMYEITSEYGFGYAVDCNNTKLADDLYNWYQNISIGHCSPRYGDFWTLATHEDEMFVGKLIDFINLK